MNRENIFLFIKNETDKIFSRYLFTLNDIQHRTLLVNEVKEIFTTHFSYIEDKVDIILEHEPCNVRLVFKDTRTNQELSLEEVVNDYICNPILKIK